MSGETVAACEACDADLERIAFRCEGCGGRYCRDHREASAHACSDDETGYATVDPASTATVDVGETSITDRRETPGGSGGSGWPLRIGVAVAGLGLVLFALPPLAFGILRTSPELLQVGIGNAVAMGVIGVVLKVVGDHLVARF